jgi:hypothetical protein
MLTLWQIFIIVMLVILLVLSAILIAINSKNISNISGGDGSSGIGQRSSHRDIDGADHRLDDEQAIINQINIQFTNHAQRQRLITINDIEQDINIINNIHDFINNYDDNSFNLNLINELLRDIPNIRNIIAINGIVPGGIVYTFHEHAIHMYRTFLDFIIHGRNEDYVDYVDDDDDDDEERRDVEGDGTGGY